MNQPPTDRKEQQHANAIALLHALKGDRDMDITLAHDKIMWAIGQRSHAQYVFAELAEAAALLRKHIPSKHTNTNDKI